MAKTTPTTATTRPAKPDLNTEVASRLRDPFEPIFMGVVRPNDPLLGEHGNNWQIYRDLKRDGKVFSGLQKRILALISRPWTVQPADGKSTSDAEAVQAILGGFNFDRLCSDLMEAMIVGFSPAEVIWTVSDNRVVPARVVKRAQRRFVYVQDDDTRAPQLRLLTQADMIRGEELEERKFIVHRVNPEDDNPYGTGLGLQLYWPVFFKRKGIIAWNKLNDRFGTPTPWGKYPRNASQKEKNTLFDALKAFSSDGVVMTAEGTLIELLETKLSGSVTTQQSLCEYMDDWIDSVLLGTEARSKSGGAMAAASKERQDVRLELTQADSDLLSETLNETLIKWICEYNGFSRCRVYREIKGEEDKKAESETDKNVSEMGFSLSLDAVRAKYGDGWDKKAAPVEPHSPENGKPSAASFAEQDRRPGDPIDALVDEALSEWRPVMAPWMQTLQQALDDAIARGDTAEELLERLPELVAQLDPGALAELLAKLGYTARLAGQAGLGDD
jgi:phage gp29-like protein